MAAPHLPKRALAVLAGALLGALFAMAPPTVESGTTLSTTTLLAPGFNLVGWTDADAPVDALVAALDGRADALFGWARAPQAFTQHRPGALPILNTFDTLRRGEGYWVLVNGTESVPWTRLANAEPLSLPLGVGFNLVAWGGPDGMALEEAVAPLGDALISVSLPAEQGAGLSTFDTRLPADLRPALVLQAGMGLWVQMAREAVWDQPASGAPPPPVVDGETQTPIAAAAGGTATSPDGRLTLEIPPGALDADTTITIRPLSLAALPPGPLGEGWTGPAYELGPDGLDLATPATATFTLDPEELRVSQNGDAEDEDSVALRMPFLIGEDGELVPLAGAQQTVDAAGGATLTVPIPHFTGVTLDNLGLSFSWSPTNVGRVRSVEATAILKGDFLVWTHEDSEGELLPETPGTVGVVATPFADAPIVPVEPLGAPVGPGAQAFFPGELARGAFVFVCEESARPGGAYRVAADVSWELPLGPGKLTVIDVGGVAECVGADFDFGDAPDDYGTLRESDGARHFPLSSSIDPNNFFLGGDIDREADGRPGPGADGDDMAGDDDEDGVLFLTDLIAGSIASVEVTLFYPPPLGLGIRTETPRLTAWIDFDCDGVFDEPEDQILAAGLPRPAAEERERVSVHEFLVPADFDPECTESYARFRLSDRLVGPTGIASFGEVEDYVVSFHPRPTGELEYLGLPLFDGLSAPPIGEEFHLVVKSPGVRGNLPVTAKLEVVDAETGERRTAMTEFARTTADCGAPDACSGNITIGGGDLGDLEVGDRVTLRVCGGDRQLLAREEFTVAETFIGLVLVPTR